MVRNLNVSYAKRLIPYIGAAVILVILFSLLVPYLWTTLGEERFISIAALAFAGVAAIVNILSLIFIGQSIRPFVSSPGGTHSIHIKQKYVMIEFKIQNTGSVPANNVQTDIDFFHENEEVTEDNLSTVYHPSVNQEDKHFILFPNSICVVLFTLNLSDDNDMQLGKDMTQGQAKYRLRITYRNFGRKHKTIQTQQLAKIELEDNTQAQPISPQFWN